MQQTIKNKNQAKDIENIYQNDRKENTILKNKLYKNQKELRKTIRKERKDLLKIVNKNKTLKFFTPSFKKDQGFLQKIKRFWADKQKRNSFLKKAFILTVVVIVTTVLCVFFPPAIAPLVSGLGVVLGAALVKKAYHTYSKRKKEELAFRKILAEKTKKEQTEKEIIKNAQSSEFAEKFENNIKKAIEIKKEKFNKASTDDKLNFLNEQKENQKKYIKFIYQEEKEKLQKISTQIKNIQKKITDKQILTNEEKIEIRNCYQELLFILKRNGLLKQYMAKISFRHRIINIATSDTAILTYLALLTIGMGFAIQKIPKISSEKTTAWTLLADDFAKQSVQLGYTVGFGNILSYPDSWRKTVVDLANLTDENNAPRMLNFDNSVNQYPYYRTINQLSAELDFSLSKEEIEAISSQTQQEYTSQNKLKAKCSISLPYEIKNSTNSLQKKTVLTQIKPMSEKTIRKKVAV